MRIGSQVAHYNAFAERHGDAILASPNPSEWTNDMLEQGPTWASMKERVAIQKRLAEQYFSKDQPVLDVGCGYGRQSYMLSKLGFQMKGVDTSDKIVGLANRLFESRGMAGDFECGSVFDLSGPEGSAVEGWPQLMLLDVIEHIPPPDRPDFMGRLARDVGSAGARMLVTFPAISGVRRRLKNVAKWVYEVPGEHPYPIPTRRSFSRLISTCFEVRAHELSPNTSFWILDSSV